MNICILFTQMILCQTQRKHAVAVDLARINSSVSRATGSSPVVKKQQREAPSKKGSAHMRATDSGSEVGSTTGGQQVSSDEQWYFDLCQWEDLNLHAHICLYLGSLLRP